MNSDATFCLLMMMQFESTEVPKGFRFRNHNAARPGSWFCELR